MSGREMADMALCAVNMFVVMFSSVHAFDWSNCIGGFECTFPGLPVGLQLRDMTHNETAAASSAIDTYCRFLSSLLLYTCMCAVVMSCLCCVP